MIKKMLQLLTLLLLIVGSVSAKNISEIIRESPYCVVGKIISVDSITYHLKIDSSLYTTFTCDTIQIFKNGNFQYNSSNSTDYVCGQTCVLFISKPYKFEEQDGYFEVGTGQKGVFQIVNDSVTYNNKKYLSFDFIQSIQSYYKQYYSFCTTFQNGEHTSKDIETFKKTTIFNQILIDETYEHCYSDNSKMDNSIPVIAAAKMNVLYVGPQNPVCIAVPKYSSSDLLVTITKGEILKNGECYNVKVFNPGKVQICVQEKKRNKMLGCTEFRVKTIPDPVVLYLGMEGGLISKSKLEAGRTIDAKMKNFDYDLNFPIKFYTVSIIYNGDKVSFSGVGRRLTPEIIEAFKKVQIGSKIYFENVLVDIGNNDERILGVIMFKVVE